MEVRAEKVEAFWRNGDDSLDPPLPTSSSGKAAPGTFSDGKLNTLGKGCVRKERKGPGDLRGGRGGRFHPV